MKPGRELNELVAMKVMGWRKGTTADGSVLDEFWIDPRADHFYGTDEGYTHRGGDYDFEDFNPSQNIKHAWEVVRKMSSFGESVFELSEGPEENCIACFAGANEAETWEHQAIGKTSPHAICLAALKAVGVDID